MADKNWHESVPKIEKIDKVDSLNKSLKIDASQETAASMSSKFQDTYAKAEPKAQAIKTLEPTAASNTTKPTPIEQAQKSTTKVLDMENTIEIAKKTQKSLNETAQTFKAAQESERIEFKKTTEKEFQNKLIHIDTSLKSALSTTGVEVSAADLQSTEKKPLVRFLDYLSSGDLQLNTLIAQLEGMNGQGNQLTPEKMLSVQIKLGFVQNELEFFSNVLNQALQAVKTIMNVQI